MARFTITLMFVLGVALNLAQTANAQAPKIKAPDLLAEYKAALYETFELPKNHKMKIVIDFSRRKEIKYRN